MTHGPCKCLFGRHMHSALRSTLCKHGRDIPIAAAWQQLPQRSGEAQAGCGLWPLGSCPLYSCSSQGLQTAGPLHTPSSDSGQPLCTTVLLCAYVSAQTWCQRYSTQHSNSADLVAAPGTQYRHVVNGVVHGGAVLRCTVQTQWQDFSTDVEST